MADSRTSALHAPRRPAARTPRWDGVLLALSGTILAFVWRVQDYNSVVRASRLPMWIGVLAALLYFASSDRRRSLRAVVNYPVVRIVFLILLLAVLSVPGSIYPGLSFRFVLSDLVRNVALLALVAASVRTFADVERLMFVQICGAILMAVMILSRFQVTDIGRLGNTGYYDANDFAMMIVCTIPIAVYFAQGHRRLVWRLTALLAVGVLVVGLAKSGSRGGFLGFVAICLYLLFAFRAVSKKVRIASVGGLIVLLAAVASDEYWGFISTLAHPTQDYNWAGNAEGGRGRGDIWIRGIGFMRAHPLLGVGARAFEVANGRLSASGERLRYGEDGGYYLSAHNAFVQIGAELGVTGLALFVAMLGSAFRAASEMGRRRTATSSDTGASQATGQVLVATLVGYVVAAFFLSQAYAAWLYVTVGIIVGHAKLARGSDVKGEAGSAGHSPMGRPPRGHRTPA